MKSFFLYIICFFSLATAFALPPAGADDYKTFLTWKENRNLTWNDFTGKPILGYVEVAMTASSIEFYYSTKQDQVNWTVTAKFFPSLSWYVKGKTSNYILKHEQLHFDITEMYVRLFRKQLKENIHSIKDLPKLKSISKSIMKQWDDEQHKYDDETDHSLDVDRQASWNLYVQQQLDALKDFASQ